MGSEQADHLSRLKRALVAVQSYRSRLDEIQAAATEPIAIIGIGCRFPGGPDPAAYWKSLREGVDSISEVPPDRWDIDAYYDSDPDAPGKMNTRWGGFLPAIDQFDPAFFGISPREARRLDPQQRLLLEVSWEALENAGQPADRLSNSSTGVFVAICSGDYGSVSMQSGVPIDTYSGTGALNSLASGRLAYVLDLHGPNLIVDTACSSSLVALHLACQSLRLGECQLALTAGVNALMLPQVTVFFSKARAMAPDGRCKTFDASADGYVRGEGCGAVVLKRLSDAIAAKDNVLAVIRGSALNHDGRSNGLTAPNGTAQQAVIRRALAFAGVKPSEVDHVETHGTGTPLGDHIEVEALAAVLGENRPPGRRFTLGAAKTNIGHLEAAAGIAGLIKVVLALQHEEIPPNLHLKKPSPLVPWAEIPADLPNVARPWKRGQRPRIAGISAFGFSGTNAHVIVEEAPVPAIPATGVERPAHLLTLSARTEQALREIAGRYRDYLTADKAAPLSDVAYSANVGRSHFPHRLALIARSGEEAINALATFESGGTSAAITAGYTQRALRPKVAFLFTGQGHEYAGVYETQPLYRRTVDRCAELAGRELTGDLALFAGEYGLAELWRSWGIEPAVVAGQGVGEYAAACIAGVMKLEDALQLAALRGKGEAYEAALREIELGEARMDIIGPANWKDQGRAETTLKKLREGLAGEGVEAYVEIGPSPQLLETLAAIYVNGAEVNWEGFDAGYQRRKVTLPTYPFQRQRYWLEIPARTQSPAVQAEHPLLGRRLHSSNNETSYETTLSQSNPPFVADHRIHGAVVIAAAHHLALMFSAAEEMQPGRIHELTNISFPEPLVISGDETRAAQVILTPAESGTYAVRVQSQGAAQSIHASATLHLDQRAPLAKMDVPAIQSALPEELPGTALPETIWGGTIEFGPSFRWIEQVRRRGSEALAQTRALEDATLTHRYLHPGLLDSVLFHAMGTLLPGSDVPWIPIGIDRFRLQGRPHARLWSHTRLHSEPGENRDLLTAGVRLTDQAAFAAEVEGIHVKRAPRESLLRFVRSEAQSEDDWLYEIKWEKVDSARELPGEGKGEHWLILADSDGVGDCLAERVRTGGGTAVVVTAASDIARSFIDGAKIVHLCNPHEASLRSSLAVMQAITAHPALAMELYLVTRGAQPVMGTSAISPEQSAAWGLGRTFALEHPAQAFRLIDLDPAGDAGASAAALMKELTRRSAENQVALRGEDTCVPRLVHTRRPAAHQLTVSAQASYLITGGLGSLGIHIAEWLVERGARSLILMSRKPASADAEIGIRNLEAQGCRVAVAAGDVTRESDIAEVIAAIPAGQPLRGIVHAAGLLDDGILLSQDWKRFEAVLAPKIQGAWNLHRQTMQLPLDFFVLFSSLASLTGSPGQSNYAAANAYLDAFAHYRRSLGLTALSINWGPWGAAGMAARSAAGRRLTGFHAIQPDQGLRMLERLMTMDIAEAAVMPVNRDLLARQMEYGYPPILTHVVQEARSRVKVSPGASAQHSEFRPQLEAAPAHKRRAMVQSLIEEEAQKLLGFAAGHRLEARQSLLEAGMDSLMATDLRNRLQDAVAASLPATLVFDYPTIDSIAEYLLRELRLPGASRGTRTPPQETPNQQSDLLAAIGELSDDEAARLIAAELAGFE